MTSRRIISNEKTILEKDDANALSPSASVKSNIAPAVPASVIIKLLTFTAAMVTMPLGSYFLILQASGNSTLSGAMAAIMANVVLVAYVIVAYQEDQSERSEEEKKKGQ